MVTGQVPIVVQVQNGKIIPSDVVKNKNCRDQSKLLVKMEAVRFPEDSYLWRMTVSSSC